MHDRAKYLTSDAGKSHQYNARSWRRLHLAIDDVEPASKKQMSDADKRKIQESLAQQLAKQKRRAFGGAVALKLSFSTTGKTPSHVQTITKNVLDLLGRPIETRGSRKGLVYYDDRQVDGLVVRCDHGNDSPWIYIEARPFREFVEDLRLAGDCAERLGLRGPELDDGDSQEHFSVLQRDEKWYRDTFGDDPFEAMLAWAQKEVQEHLLGLSKLGLPDLRDIYCEKGSFGDQLRKLTEQLLASYPMKIQLPELPQVEGSSGDYRMQVDAAVKAFSEQFKRELTPLRIPVALEVLVKPPKPVKGKVVHDLDNVARNYLIPRIIDYLGPPSHPAFLVDLEGVRRHSPELAEAWQPILTKLPRSTRIGLTRYEVWRLPRADTEDSKGFVSAAITYDPAGAEDVLTRIDEVVREWQKTLK